MKAGYIQMTPDRGNPDGNLKRVETLFNGIDSELMVLPELFGTGYIFSSRDELRSMSEPIPGGRTCQFLLDLSRKTGIAIVAGLPESAGDAIFNSCIFCDPDGILHKYRKIHLFNTEKEIFDPGDTGFSVFDYKGVSIGMMICFDWIFPEATRTLAMMGADLVVHPSNLVLPYCPQAMITRCIENRVFAITCNRSGIERHNNLELDFIGNSRIILPSGEILGKAGYESGVVHVATIKPDLARNKQITPGNHVIKDRRPEFYCA